MPKRKRKGKFNKYKSVNLKPRKNGPIPKIDLEKIKKCFLVIQQQDLQLLKEAENYLADIERNTLFSKVLIDLFEKSVFQMR